MQHPSNDSLVDTNIRIFRFLGWFSVVSNGIGILIAYWADALFFDFSFIIWFAIARKLNEGSIGVAKFAFWLALLVEIAIAASFAFHFLGHPIEMRTGKLKIDSQGWLAPLFLFGMALAFAFPLSLKSKAARLELKARKMALLNAEDCT